MGYKRFVDDADYPTCLAPWHALTIKWGGNVIPDIIYKGSLGNINRQTLKEILEGEKAVALRTAHRNRELPETCIGCQKKEKSGKSRRLYFWDRLDWPVKLKSNELQVNTPHDIRYLDFTLSNKCNLACIHCGPFVSTGWTKDGKKLNKEAPAYWGEQPIGYHGAEVNFMDNLFANPEYFKNLQWLALRGGEPLYDEKCKELLQWFIDNDKAQDLMLDISTNATVFDEDFKEMFKHFKHIELNISIEATDELYSIIRGGPYKWEQLQDNIEKFYEYDNIEVVFAVTVMNTNVMHLDKIWDWFDANHKHRASISMSNVVVNPGYLNIAYLPEELKHIAMDKIARIPNEAIWPAGSYHEKEMQYGTGIENIKKGLCNTPDAKEQEKYWDYFLQYTKDLDRLRSTNTFAEISEFKSYE